MTLVRRTSPAAFDVFDRLFGHWPGVVRRQVMLFPETMEDVLRVEEYRDNGALVVRADIPGIDPAKDVEVTMSDGMLHIAAERREESTSEKKDFYRHELRYGSFSRTLPMPEGATEADVKATYRDGVLEVRVPISQSAPEATAKKIPVAAN